MTSFVGMRKHLCVSIYLPGLDNYLSKSLGYRRVPIQNEWDDGACRRESREKLSKGKEIND